MYHDIMEECNITLKQRRVDVGYAPPPLDLFLFVCVLKFCLMIAL